MFIRSFDTRIVPRTRTDADKLYYLEQQLSGDPKELIEGCLYMDPSTGYHTARSLLQQEYGDPVKISSEYLSKAMSWPTVKHDDNTGLKKYSLFLIKCYNAMQCISHMTVFNHTPNLQALVQKLPAYICRTNGGKLLTKSEKLSIE